MSVKREILGAGLALLGTAAYVAWKRLGARQASAPAPVPAFEIHPRLLENSAADQGRLIAAAPAALVVPPVSTAALPYSRSAPHEFPEFGHDLERNSDDITLDDYLTMPLEGSGVTYTNRTKFVDLDAAETTKPSVERFRFIRLKVLETRDPAAGKVCLGGIRLFWGALAIDLPGTTAWNPHTGVRKPWVPTDGWTDADQYELIICFPHAVEVTRYQLRTSREAADCDPQKWRLEGSQNGTFWLPLDDRGSGGFVPEERGVWMNYKCAL